MPRTYLDSPIFKAGKYVVKSAYPQQYASIKGLLASVKNPGRASPNAGLSPGRILKGTKLGRYLDQKYEKKCGVEVKHYQASQTYTITTTLATPAALQFPLDQTILQGTGMSSRVGAMFEVKSLEMNCTITPNATNNAAVRVRLFLVKCGKQINGALPPTGQIIWTTNNIRSPLVPVSEHNVEFTIVDEKVFSLAPIGSSSHQDRVDFQWNYYPKTCHIVEFSDSDTGGFTATCDRGLMAIYAMYETAGTAGLPLLSVNYEYNWIDS